MSMENNVAVQLPPETLQEAQTKIAELNSLLAPYLVAMTPKQRQTVPKMGDGTLPFVEKALDYSKSNPQFVPPFLNPDDLAIDFKAVKDLSSLSKPLEQLLSNLVDTITMSGSEGFVAGLSIYSSVKLAARMNVPGAKPIYDDLKKRFERPSAGGNGQGNS